MTNDTTPLPDTDDPFKVYIAGLRRALGSREPLEVLREMPAELRRAVAGLSPAQLATPEAPKKWSVAQVVQHLADSDLVVGFRIRMVLSHERPELAAYDQDLWADHLAYADADVETALEDFTRLRHANLRLLERASAEERRRVGMHTERGPESIEDMLPNVAGHDIVHLRQVARIRQSLGAPTAP